jgi:hypothetical protein
MCVLSVVTEESGAMEIIKYILKTAGNIKAVILGGELISFSHPSSLLSSRSLGSYPALETVLETLLVSLAPDH